MGMGGFSTASPIKDGANPVSNGGQENSPQKSKIKDKEDKYDLH